MFVPNQISKIVFSSNLNLRFLFIYSLDSKA
jgi:hypothetical protein